MKKVILSKPNAVQEIWIVPKYLYLVSSLNCYSNLFEMLNFDKEECFKAIYKTFEDLGKAYIQKKKDEAKDSDKMFAAAKAETVFSHFAEKVGFKPNPKYPTSLLSFVGREFNVGTDSATPLKNDVISMDKNHHFTLDEDKLREKLIVYVTGEDAEKVNKIHSICDDLNRLFPHQPRRGFMNMIELSDEGFHPRESITLDEFHDITK